MAVWTITTFERFLQHVLRLLIVIGVQLGIKQKNEQLFLVRKNLRCFTGDLSQGKKSRFNAVS